MKRFILSIFILCSFVQAQDLVTDRPDQTESAVVVPKNSLQVETGIIYESDDFGGIKSSSLGIATTLLRYGLTENFELRLGSGYTSQEIETPFATADNSGLGGLYVGAKIQFGGFAFFDDAALLVHSELPVGDEAIVGDKAEPGFLFSVSNDLSDKLSFGWNLGANYVDDDFLQLVFSAALGIGLTEKVGAFLEIYGDKSKDVDTQFLFDAGFTYLIKSNVQLDASFGTALTEEAPDYFLNAGLSFRLPK